MADEKKPDEKFNFGKYYNSLGRIFRSGPLVRHRIASKIQAPGEVGVPVGTARAFLKATSTSYTSQMSSYGQYNRLSRYSDYNEMESMAEIGSALDIYADEICAKGEFGEIIRIDSDNPDIRKALLVLFYDVLNIEFNAWSWIRNLCKYGDQFLIVDHNPDYGVLNCIQMPVNEVEREEGFDKDNPLAYRYRWLSHGQIPIENWQIIHFRLLGNDGFLPYGTSILEPARRVWRQLILMEDAVMVYRIVRSPERRVFYVDVGNIDPNDVPKYIEKVREMMKQNQVVDSDTGRVDLRYNVMSVDEDYFIPVRGTEGASRIESLPGGQFTGDIEDLQYIQNKLFAALKIPKSYLGYEGDINAKSTLSQEDVRFAKTVQRMQRVFIAELNKIAIIHLYSMGYRNSDMLNFEITMANPSTISEIQRLELWRTKAEVSSIFQEGTFDRQWAYKNIFRLSDEDIESIEEGKRRDALFQHELEQLASEGQVEEQPAAAAETPPPEETEPAPTGEPPLMDPNADMGAAPITAGASHLGRDPNQQKAAPNELIKANPGKKKSVYDVPNLNNYVFNTKKNALGDPNDAANLRRVITSPFGESRDPEDVVFHKRVNQLNRLINEMDQIDKLRDARAGKGKKIL